MFLNLVYKSNEKYLITKTIYHINNDIFQLKNLIFAKIKFEDELSIYRQYI